MPSDNPQQTDSQKQSQQAGQSMTGPGEGAGTTGQGEKLAARTGQGGGQKTPAEQRSFTPDDADQRSASTAAEIGRDPETDRGQGGQSGGGVER